MSGRSPHYGVLVGKVPHTAWSLSMIVYSTVKSSTITYQYYPNSSQQQWLGFNPSGSGASLAEPEPCKWWLPCKLISTWNTMGFPHLWIYSMFVYPRINPHVSNKLNQHCRINMEHFRCIEKLGWTFVLDRQITTNRSGSPVFWYVSGVWISGYH
jgi:hypothetical protein